MLVNYTLILKFFARQQKTRGNHKHLGRFFGTLVYTAVFG